MNTFLETEASPERLMWCAVIHQAVRDLAHPNSNQWAQQTLQPAHHPTWLSAMQLIFSGKEDDHEAWTYSGIDPKAIRAEVIRKMKTGETVGQIGSRESPLGPIDYREARRHLLAAWKQVEKFYSNQKESALEAMFAKDAWMDVIPLLSMGKKDKRDGWGVEV